MGTTSGRNKMDERDLKSKAFTICLTQDTYDKLVLLAKKNRQKPATMARLVVEDAVEKIG